MSASISHFRFFEVNRLVNSNEFITRPLSYLLSVFFLFNITSFMLISCISVASAASKDSYAATKYPIILVPGFGSTDKLFVIIDYWYGIPEDLRAHGANVYVSTSSALQRPDGDNGRGEQLLAYVKSVLAVTGADKVNLIGYSQGGLTARYVAAVAPELVASVTTIGTPHHGSELADYFDELFNQGLTLLLSRFMATFNNMVAFMTTGNPNQDMLAGLKSLTTSEVALFNKNYPSAGLAKRGACETGEEFETVGSERQYLYSWSGAAMKETRSIFGTKVIDTSVLPIIDAANLVDPSTKVMHYLGTVMVNRNSGTNDGMVSRCSSMFGRVISNQFNWNHFDQINQVLGIRGAYAENPLAVIRTHVNRLKMQGL
ncbi:MAG TPA: lipase family alpha/beta hydrolase [Xylella sp.]